MISFSLTFLLLSPPKKKKKKKKKKNRQIPYNQNNFIPLIRFNPDLSSCSKEASNGDTYLVIDAPVEGELVSLVWEQVVGPTLECVEGTFDIFFFFFFYFHFISFHFISFHFLIFFSKTTPSPPKQTQKLWWKRKQIFIFSSKLSAPL